MDNGLSGEIFCWRSQELRRYRGLHDFPCFAIADEKIVIIGDDGHTDIVGILTICENCYQSFDSIEFNNHICDYDEHKSLILTDELMGILWSKSPLRRMLIENQHNIESRLKRINGVATTNASSTRGKSANTSNYTCPLCNRMYVHASGLARHLEIHNTVDDKQSSTATDNVYGLIVATVVEVFKCLICGQLFNSKANCLAHMVANHTDYDIDENDCIHEYESKAFERVSVNQVYACEYCMASFDSIVMLQQHQSHHDVTIAFECRSCDISSRNIKFILNHRNRECPYEKFQKAHKIESTVQFVCNCCEFICATLMKLYEHRYASKHFQSLPNKSTGQLEYLCEKCGQILADVESLLTHAGAAHAGKKYKSLAVDMNASVRPYLCEVCGKGYTQSSHLYQHLRFHKGIKPFECNMANCTRRFTIRPDLNDHIRKCHTGERPYKCTDCNKTFLTGSVYYQHRLIHRNERRYGCSTCQKRFHRSDALKNHERIHSGEKPYACSVCTKTFRQKGDRDKHVRSRHQK